MIYTESGSTLKSYLVQYYNIEQHMTHHIIQILSILTRKIDLRLCRENKRFSSRSFFASCRKYDIRLKLFCLKIKLITIIN